MRSTRFREWCFTINNPDPTKDENFTETTYREYKISYILFSLEKGDEGTPHYQGYVYFSNPRTLGGIKRLNFFKRAHLEVARGSYDDNRTYILKAPLSTVEFGVPPSQGKRNDLEEVKTYVMESNASYDDVLLTYPLVVAKYPRFVRDLINVREKERSRELYYQFVEQECTKRVIVLYGDAGSGKTSFVYKNHPIEDIYKLSLGDGSSSSVWFDDYNGESVLLLDDYYGQLRYSYFLRLLDIYPVRSQCKGSFVNCNFTTIYITSNTHPDNWYLNVPSIEALKRRITEIHLVERPGTQKQDCGDLVLPPHFCALWDPTCNPELQPETIFRD